VLLSVSPYVRLWALKAMVRGSIGRTGMAAAARTQRVPIRRADPKFFTFLQLN